MFSMLERKEMARNSGHVMFFFPLRDSSEQFGRLDLQNIRKGNDGVEAGRIVAVLDLGDVGSGIASPRGEFFLRQSTLAPKRR